MCSEAHAVEYKNQPGDRTEVDATSRVNPSGLAESITLDAPGQLVPCVLPVRQALFENARGAP